MKAARLRETEEGREKSRDRQERTGQDSRISRRMSGGDLRRAQLNETRAPRDATAACRDSRSR